MGSLGTITEEIVQIVWGLPLVTLITFAGIFLLIYSRLTPFRYLIHALGLLLRKEGNTCSGGLSHWRALCTALSGTIGMGNIAGVAIAISTGGSGAIFWMWIVAILGMSIKFFTCSLSCLYRKRDSKGNLLGGPMYYIELGLGQGHRYLALIFAACGMIGCLGIFQANQLSTLIEAQYGLAGTTTGLLMALAVGLIARGGIVSVGSFASKAVPIMGLFYLAGSLFVVIAHLDMVPIVLKSIFAGAFEPSAAIGGAAGLSVREIIIVGTKRAIFSNEAGVGTEALAHSTAKTDEPIREGLVGMLGPILDTHLICTATAMVILTSDTQFEIGILAVAAAFEQTMPGFGGLSLSCIFLAFGFSTLVTYAFYSQRCAKYLLGNTLGEYYLAVYLLFLIVAPSWNPQTALNLIDIAFALMAFPNIIATLFLAREVRNALRKYIRSRNE